MMNIMNPPADWSTLKKLIWLRGTPITGGEELTVSGTPPLSLPNSLGKPLKAWSVDVLPYQEGTGDPSPDNVRPIHGTDKLTIYTDSKYGGLVEWNQLFIAPYSRTGSGITITRNSPDDPYLRIDGTASAVVYVWLSGMQYTIVGHVYFVDRDSTDTDFVIYNDGGGINTGSNQSAVQTATDSKRFYVRIENGATFDNFSCRPMICDLTQMFGAGNEPATVEEFRSLFPLNYYPYNAGQQMTVDQVNGAQYSPAVLTLPQTVYTGTIGSEGGESRWGEVDLGTLTWAYNSENNRFDGPTISSSKRWGEKDVTANAVCECLKTVSFDNLYNGADSAIAFDAKLLRARSTAFGTDADAFKTAMSGIKLVYELATPVQFPLTAPTIPTPTGTATTWATAEDGTVDSMEVTYVGKA